MRPQSSAIVKQLGNQGQSQSSYSFLKRYSLSAISYSNVPYNSRALTHKRRFDMSWQGEPAHVTTPQLWNVQFVKHIQLEIPQTMLLSRNHWNRACLNICKTSSLADSRCSTPKGNANHVLEICSNTKMQEEFGDLPFEKPVWAFHRQWIWDTNGYQLYRASTILIHTNSSAVKIVEAGIKSFTVRHENMYVHDSDLGAYHEVAAENSGMGSVLLACSLATRQTDRGYWSYYRCCGAEVWPISVHFVSPAVGSHSSTTMRAASLYLAYIEHLKKSAYHRS